MNNLFKVLCVILPFPVLPSRLLLDQIHNLSGPTSESNLFLICSLQDTNTTMGEGKKKKSAL